MALVDTSSRRTATLTPLVPTACQRATTGPTLLDDFNRADETPLSDGGKWTQRGAGEQLRLVSNQATGITTITETQVWHDAQFGPDCEVYFTLGVASGAIRFYLRVANVGLAGETGYMVAWLSGSCTIYKETALETFTQLATNATTFATGDIVGFRATGTTLAALKNGVAVLTATDSTFSNAGYFVIGCNDTTIRIDDFSGGTL